MSSEFLSPMTRETVPTRVRKEKKCCHNQRVSRKVCKISSERTGKTHIVAWSVNVIGKISVANVNMSGLECKYQLVRELYKLLRNRAQALVVVMDKISMYNISQAQKSSEEITFLYKLFRNSASREQQHSWLHVFVVVMDKMSMYTLLKLRKVLKK